MLIGLSARVVRDGEADLRTKVDELLSRYTQAPSRKGNGTGVDAPKPAEAMV